MWRQFVRSAQTHLSSNEPQSTKRAFSSRESSVAASASSSSRGESSSEELTSSTVSTLSTRQENLAGKSRDRTARKQSREPSAVVVWAEEPRRENIFIMFVPYALGGGWSHAPRRVRGAVDEALDPPAITCARDAKVSVTPWRNIIAALNAKLTTRRVGLDEQLSSLARPRAARRAQLISYALHI